MVLKAALKNEQHPEYGLVTIPFPIPKKEYDSTIRMLEALDIGDAVRRDCTVEEVQSGCSILQRLEGKQVNVDELDYLAKRLDSFVDSELAQFQGMACKLNLTDIKDLINLSFSCQQATVITDFSDLEEIGRSHYLNTHGGCASMEELEQLDGTETAILLIEDNEGTITRYGVVYDNGMQLLQLYDGKHLPCYHYEEDVISVGLSSRQEPEDGKNLTWIYLPASQGQIQRAMARAGIADPADLLLWMGDSVFPEEVGVALDFRQEDIYELNALAWAVDRLSNDGRKKLGVAVHLAEPECAGQIRQLAENLDLFDFAPGAHTPAEYGKYMIQQSGRFDYDPNLDKFYDYEGYAQRHMDQEAGMFTDRGYIAYTGSVSLEELMADPAEQYQQELGAGMGLSLIHI